MIKKVGGYFLHPGDPDFRFENHEDNYVWPLLNAAEYEHAYKLWFFGKG